MLASHCVASLLFSVLASRVWPTSVLVFVVSSMHQAAVVPVYVLLINIVHDALLHAN